MHSPATPFKPPMQEILERRRVSQAYQYLLRGILSGELPAGTILSEVAVAADIGLSRTPVHDALSQLVSDGLVNREPNRRATVAGFTADDAYEIFEMRKLLEGQAAELAAGRMDARQLLPLREFAQYLRGNVDANWVENWAEYDEQFHSMIAACCGNRLLQKDIARYRLLHRCLNLLFTDASALQGALAEHECIQSALEARDGIAARRLMVEHISHWQHFFVQQWPAMQRKRISA